MAAISQVIPNLLGGVSQQPDPVKLPGQLRQAENVLLDPTFGCRKRPPTSFIATLSTNIPDDAKWFPIFRDGNERYVVAIYREDDATVIKAYEADTGTERSVTIDASAVDYLNVARPRDINELTINDYTLLANNEINVSMSDSVPEPANKDGIVVVNQVAYNTTYGIDFLKDGESTQQEKVYSATSLSVSPGSFEEEDEGACTYAGSDSFNKDQGDKVSLGFTLTTTCNPTLVTTEKPGLNYPTAVSYSIPQPQMYFTALHGSADSYPVGQYLRSTVTVNNGSLSVSIECRVNSKFYGDGNRFDETGAQIANYDQQRNWQLGEGGNHSAGGATATYLVTNVRAGQKVEEYSYKSVYSTKVQLRNGGRNWRIGDSVNVSVQGKSYRVTVTGETFGYSYVSEASVSYTTPLNVEEGTLDVASIVGGLTAQISALDDYVATPIGNVIYIQRSDDRDFNMQVRGGTTNNALYGIKGSVNDVSLLPSQCVPSVVLLVRNSAESDADDYYVKFKSSAGDIPGQGSWEETVKPGIPTDLNLSTMPVVMTRNSDATFTVRALSPEFSEDLFWAPRDVGDEDSNPAPSFVGKGIKDMFFYMNRLGFLSQDSVILSQPGDYFNFFVGSAIAVSDADPIDMTASSTKPATLKAALGTTKGLLLFAENSQFLLSTSEAAFGPSTVKMSELSNYSYSSKVRPLETGVSVLFSTEADTFSKVYEMAVDSIDNRPLVSENTRIVPEYIPPGLTLSASSPNNSLVVYGNDTEALWTFKFFNTGNERSLAGWAKWIMPAPVQMVSFDHDTGYFVCNNDGKSILLKLEMLDDPRTSPISAFGFKFAPRLDCSLLKEQTTIEDTADDKIKKIRIPDGSYVDGKVANIILTVNGDSTLYRTTPVLSDSTSDYIEVDADIASGEYIVGLEYEMKIELPSFFVVSDKVPDRKNIPMVENVYIDLYYSGRYDITLSRLGYRDRSLDLEVVQSDIYIANAAALDEIASREVPVYCRGDYANLTIRATAPLPASITSYRWEGHYNNRGIATI